jgi:hypothetical protein
MMDRMLPNLPSAIVIFMPVAGVSLRVATERPKPEWVLAAEPVRVSVTADDSARHLAAAVVTTDTDETAGNAMAAKLLSIRGQVNNAVEQMHHIFHELHADGHNANCSVCDGQS